MYFNGNKHGLGSTCSIKKQKKKEKSEGSESLFRCSSGPNKSVQCSLFLPETRVNGYVDHVWYEAKRGTMSGSK